jgi:hypothetical protein
MKKAHEYHQRAEECRALAKRASQAEYRAALIEMAETWENLAHERETFVTRQRRIAALNEKMKQFGLSSG